MRRAHTNQAGRLLGQSRRSTNAAAITLVVAFITGAALVIVEGARTAWRPSDTGPLGLAGVVLVALAVIAAAGARAVRPRSTAWTLLAVGVAAWATGVVVGDADRHVLGVSPNNWLHAGAVAFAGLAMLGLATLGHSGPGRGQLAVFIEAALLADGVAIVVWELLLFWDGRDPARLSGARELAMAQPAAGVSLGVITLLLVSRDRSRELVLCAIGALLVGAALATRGLDGSRGFDRWQPSTLTLAVGTVGILVGLGVIAVASWFTPEPAASTGRPASRPLIVLVASSGAIIVFLWRHVVAGVGRTSTIVVLAIIGAALICADQLLKWRDERRDARRFSSTIARLASTETELRELVDDLPVAVVMVDQDGVVHSANALVTALTGRQPADLAGKSLLDLVSRRDRAVVVERWGEFLDGATVLPDLVFNLVHPEGAETLVEASALVPIRDRSRIVITLRNVTEREAGSRALEQARRRFQQAFHSAPTGMALVRLSDGVLVDANRSLAEMLGYPVAELVGRGIRELTHPDDLRASAPQRARLELGIVDTYLLEQRYIRSDGQWVWAKTRVSVTEDDGVPLAITHIEDVTDQRRSAEQLRWAATHDELTALPNRSFLVGRLDERLAEAATGSIALLFIDLDNFKVVNDSLGHGVGDDLLKAMAEQLRSVVRDRDTLARFGGDEFIVMLDGLGEGVDPHDVAERLRVAIHEPVVVDGTELFVTGSIGYTVNDTAGLTADDLLRDADAAMYRAKARGRNCVEAFAPGSHESSVLVLRTGNELRRGVERGEIVPYFQPIVNLTSGHVVGFEVLARWRHPDRGLLAPDQFLPLAEETGLVGAIGASVLRDSLAQLATWRERGLPFASATLSVNVGTRQLVDFEFHSLVSEALAESGVSADSLWLEITETALLSDVKAAEIALRRLRSLGLHLVVDDFGTGYSSLTYLKRFPVEAIKIDRAFIAGLGIESEDTTIVEAVINLGHSLNLGVVAEGVESPLQLSRLRELGCDRGQGYLFGRPRPAEIVEAERADR